MSEELTCDCCDQDEWAPLSEHALFRATPRVRRTEPCACGSPVVALANESDAEVVARHVQTPDHLAWRFGQP